MTEDDAAGSNRSGKPEPRRPLAFTQKEQRAEESVRGPILIPFTLLLVFVVASFLVTAHELEDRTQTVAMNASVNGVQQLMELEIDKGAAMMHSVIDGMSQDAELRRLLAARDRSGLLARVEPFYQHLRAHQSITHLYFDTPDRVNILRVHDPSLTGDTIDRTTTIQALRHPDGASGLEVGVLGSLTLRAVEPWRDPDGTVIGLVEMGQDIAGLTKQIGRILGVDLVVAVHKDLVDQPRWQEGNQALGRRPKWSNLDFGNSAIVASTLDHTPPQLGQLIASSERSERTLIRSEDGSRRLYTAFVPLDDAAHRRIGDILIVRDVTRLREAYRHTTAMVAAISIMAAVLVFFLFAAIIKRVERDYRRKNEIERQFLRLSSEHERIIQIEKLSEVGRAIGEIAHQLNNPLVGVVNLSQLAERTVNDPERTRGLLGEIRRAGEDCRSLVLRMLQFTKVSRSERHPTALSGVVRDTIALIQQSAASSRPVKVETPDGDVVLNIDPSLVRHALFNLLTNAESVSPPDTEIIVRLHHQKGDEKEWWGLSVLDGGPGVPKDLMNRIFMPFFSTRADGTGLGLPVAQHVAMLHGGRVGVFNRPAGGACFTIWLPVDTGQDKAAEQGGGI